MAHENYEEMVSAFVDGQIGSEEEEALFEHLAGCVGCREFLRKSVELQAHLAVSKVKTLAPPTREPQPLHSNDRTPVRGLDRRSKYARIRSIAFLAIVLLVAGLFWSTTLPRYTDSQLGTSEETLSTGLSKYQP